MRVYAVFGNTVFDLNRGDPAYFEGEDGLGMADLHRLEERGPLQHGSTDRGYRLDPRIASYVFGVFGWTKSDLWNKRDELLNIFRPVYTIVMKHELDNGLVRCLDCVFAGGLKMPAQDRHGGIFQKVAITLKADDPTFYDPVAQAVTFNLAGGGSGAVPSAVPMLVGTSTLNQDIVIEYAGSALSYPQLIRITGPITDCVITNLTTDEKLDFTGVTIAGSDYYDIDLRYGYKTVKDKAGANKLADLTDDSDLATWHLTAEKGGTLIQGPGGEWVCLNGIRVTGSSVTESTEVEMTYHNRYLGI